MNLMAGTILTIVRVYSICLLNEQANETGEVTIYMSGSIEL